MEGDLRYPVTGVLPLVALLLVAFVVTGVRQPRAETVNLSGDDARTLVLLLSQKTHSVTKDALTDRLAKWSTGTIKYRIMGTATSVVLDAIGAVNKVLADGEATISLAPSSDPESEDILIVIDTDSSKIFSHYGLDAMRVLSAPNGRISEEAFKTEKAILEAGTTPCFGVKDRVQFAFAKATIFAASTQTSEEMSHCIYSELLSSLGLANRGVTGNSVMNAKSRLVAPSIVDKVALLALYKADLAPGATVEEAMRKYFPTVDIHN